MTVVIDAKSISKKYPIYHASQGAYSTIVESVTRAVKNFCRRDRNQNSFEEFWALKDVSFQIHKGDRVGIIGKNGAGKSTLLKILSRIVAPTEGSIEIQGRIASLLEVGTGFHPELTGRENIFLNGAILGMAKKEIQAKFDEIVAFSEIEKFLDTPVKYYSSGMYARLGFSIAAHLDPDILIVDEVLAVGDASFQTKCLKKLNDLSQGGRTILFVSHNTQALTALCNTGIFLEHGLVKAAGSIETCLNHYLKEVKPSSFTWKGSSGNDALKIHSFELEHQDAFFYQNEIPLLKMEIEVLRPLQDAILGIEIKNSRKQTVLHSFITQNPTVKSAISVPGKHMLKVPISMEMLWEGEYTLKPNYFFPHHSNIFSDDIFLKFPVYPLRQPTIQTDNSHMEGIHLPATWEVVSHG